MAHKYAKLDKIGEGSFGLVYKAKDKDTGELVALKRIRINEEEEGVPCAAIREISLLKELRHPNIVRLLDVVLTLHKLTLVFEYLDQDLKKFMDLHHDLDNGMIRHLMCELLQGLSYCHHRSVLHRDLKPQNILISKGRLKIADFGLGRALGIPVKRHTPDVVTLWYRSPDVVLGSEDYDFGIDIWSVGCIFAEMITSQPLFTGKVAQEQLLSIFKTLGTPNLEVWPSMHSYRHSSTFLSNEDFHVMHECKIIGTMSSVVGKNGVDLLMKMLQWEPSNRIQAADALKHKYCASQVTAF